MNKERTIEILFNLVSNYPYVVTFMTYLGIFIGVILFWSSIKSFRRASTSGVGLDSKTPSEWQSTGFRQVFFGIVFINFYVFIQLILEGMGITNIDGDFLLKRDIFEETQTVDLVSYLVWTFNLLGVAWFLRGFYVLNKSFEDHNHKRGIGILFIVLGIIGIHIYYFSTLLAYGLGNGTLLKWLGVN